MTQKRTFLGTLAHTLLSRMSRGRLPKTSGELTLEGLSAPVEILRDRWGVAHIYAKNQDDLFFAQGFVHAQDRLFQMELNRRTAAGRLSEIFGEMALETDRFVRTFGFNRLGRAELEQASPEIKNILDAYTAGVNAFIERGKFPIEFTLLRHQPAHWEALDSTIFSRLMVWELSHAWQSEIVRAELAETAGVEHAAEWEIHPLARNPVTLPEGIEFNALDPDGTLRYIPGPFLDRGKGSNEWVISPQRSETGHAVLCNDMHLALGIPSLWHEIHLNAPDFHVSGVTLPGLPMVLTGHNERIAWGITLAYTDAEDLFVEQIDTHDPPRYLHQDEWHEVEIIEEPITIKGQTEPFIERVMVTRHGPIISNQVGQSGTKLAVQSMALRPVPLFDGWLRLNTAANWDDFVEAMRCIEAPQLNIAYADVDDNIGFWMTGKIPVRAQGNGSVPVPGWSGDYEWVGEVPFEEMPHAFNPQRGFLVNCNNKVVDDDYPHDLGNAWMSGYRARRLTELIEGRATLSMQDHQEFQMDTHCIPGLELVAHLDGFSNPDADVQLALRLLRTWDGDLGPESVGGAVYEVLRRTLIHELLTPSLGESLTQRVLGKGIHPLLARANEFYGHDTIALLNILDNPRSWWLQQAGGRDALLQKALKQTIASLRETLGEDTAKWQWGKLHRITFAHSMSMQKPFDQVFDRGPFPIGGDTDTPLQTATMPGGGFDEIAWAPSFRQIVDLGNWDNSVAIHPPGQSGQLASPHYDDALRPWLDGEYHPMLWSRERVEAEAVARLTLIGNS
ncbi:MAG TPA: penicillin acylase family protein [Anaerolineales bacterium]|nr:penicillin acylase family protein [Anaerolineales bacterium]